MSDTLAVAKGDYILAESPEYKEAVLMKASGSRDGVVSGVLVKFQNIPELRTVLDVQAQNVILNLGPTPMRGKVYGHDVSNLYRGSVDHEHFGRLCFMYKPDPETKKSIVRGFNLAYKKLQKFGLEQLARDNIVWEINPPGKEKYAGMYIPAKTKAKVQVPARIMIRPEILTAPEFPYVVLHELGHHLHSTYMRSPKLEAAWIKLFNTSIKVVPVSRADCEQMLESLVAGEERPSAFRKSLEEDQQLMFRWIIRHISQNHSVTIRELDHLFEGEELDEIRQLWPQKAVPTKELDPIISEYATKSYRETLAEAFAMHLTGTQFPKHIIKLTERTIAYAKAQFGSSPDSE